jgi:hypothetical protein
VVRYDDDENPENIPNNCRLVVDAFTVPVRVQRSCCKNDILKSILTFERPNFAPILTSFQPFNQGWIQGAKPAPPPFGCGPFTSSRPICRSFHFRSLCSFLSPVCRYTLCQQYFQICAKLQVRAYCKNVREVIQ